VAGWGRQTGAVIRSPDHPWETVPFFSNTEMLLNADKAPDLKAGFQMERPFQSMVFLRPMENK